MSSGEWKTITRLDKKRVMRRRGRNIPRSRNDVHTSSTALIEDFDVLEHVVGECMKELGQSQLYQTLILQLNGTALFRHLVCYGIGNFSASSTEHFSASMWQIACALCLQRDLGGNKDNIIMVSYYDPCMSPLEVRFLEHREIQVLTTNDRGRLFVGHDGPTIFFMPHCPKALYNNVTWAHWSCLESTAILGNSLVNHAEALANNKRSCPCLQILVPWIREQKLESPRRDLQQATGNFLGAFNDLYLTGFMSKAAGWPERPDDLKLIDDDDDGELL